MGNNKERENLQQSCRAIAHHLSICKDIELQELMLSDLLFKTSNLPNSRKLAYLLSSFQEYIPERLRSMISNEISRNTHSARDKFDVGIITVIPPELDAVKIVFEIPLHQTEFKAVKGIRFWKTTIQSTTGDVISVLVTMAGEAGQSNFAVTCDTIFNAFDLDLCVVVGIGAGLKGKVDLGEVIIGSPIIGYELQRIEPDSPLYRPTSGEVDLVLKRKIGYFQVSSDWEEKLAYYKQLLVNASGIDYLYEKTPKVSIAAIASGDKLIADGKFLPMMREKLHESIRCGDMESAGFTRSCREYSLKWMVFRSVSDFGDDDKPKYKRFQSFFALIAALALKQFLETEFMRASDPEM